MRLVFYWNFLNHHQVGVADDLYRILGDEFRFVTTMSLGEKDMKGGGDFSNRPYCIRATESDANHQLALELAQETDVCVFGACSQEYAVVRARCIIKQSISTTKKLSFECGERWLKRGWLNVLSPVLRRWWWNYMRYYRKASFYKLCSSAYAAKDDEKLGAYKDRHYKWGYFTDVDPYLVDNKDSSSITNILWVGRFIGWKHPELAIGLIERLKDDGYNVHLDMYGDGQMKTEQESWVEKHVLTDVVSFHGNVPNGEIQKTMCNSEILLLTSDRMEGWGVVANEAMANGCCLVGSDSCGAVPYLLSINANGDESDYGVVFKSGSAEDIYQKIKYLLDNPSEISSKAQAGYQYILDVWSPKHAAESLLLLIDDLQNGRETSVQEGPCSKA